MLIYSGRELFLADASLFVDDEEAYDSYVREDGPDEVEASGSTQQVCAAFLSQLITVHIMRSSMRCLSQQSGMHGVLSSMCRFEVGVCLTSL
jgi:hypothetical protein